MISHEYKCIFIHIPRTGGTSFERAIFGGNWWQYSKETKHLLASQAREVYSDFWDSYFKFAIVRNPWDRCVSMLKFSKNYYGVAGDELTKEKLEWYRQRYNWPVTIEYDYRFYSLSEVVNDKHTNNQVYGNILDEELDYLARFETLRDDFVEVSKLIGLNSPQLPKLASYEGRGRDYRSYYNEVTKGMVCELYEKDIKEYSYSF